MKNLIMTLVLGITTNIFAQCSHIELGGKWEVFEDGRGSLGVIEISSNHTNFGDTGFGKQFFSITNMTGLVADGFGNANYLGKIYFEKEDMCGITYFYSEGQELVGYTLIEEVKGYRLLGGLLGEEEYMVTYDKNKNSRLTWILLNR